MRINGISIQQNMGRVLQTQKKLDFVEDAK